MDQGLDQLVETWKGACARAMTPFSVSELLEMLYWKTATFWFRTGVYGLLDMVTGLELTRLVSIEYEGVVCDSFGCFQSCWKRCTGRLRRCVVVVRRLWFDRRLEMTSGRLLTVSSFIPLDDFHLRFSTFGRCCVIRQGRVYVVLTRCFV